MTSSELRAQILRQPKPLEREPIEDGYLCQHTRVSLISYKRRTINNEPTSQPKDSLYDVQMINRCSPSNAFDQQGEGEREREIPREPEMKGTQQSSVKHNDNHAAAICT